MRLSVRVLTSWLGMSSLIAAGIMASPGLASAAIARPAGDSAQTCTGTVGSPGALAGNYSNLTITGSCVANSGPVNIAGNLTITSTGALTAIWALNDQTGSGNSNITVQGNVTVDSGGSLMMGCYSLVNQQWGVTQLLNIPDFPCFDDPNPGAPTLNTHDVIDGNLVANNPLGVVLHGVTIGGNVVQNGGGAGTSCTPVGIFNQYFGLPEWTDYANTVVDGNLSLSGLDTCWDGMFRNVVHGNMVLTNNAGGLFFGAADANEYADNQVLGNLTCSGNNPAAQLGDSDGGPNQVAGNATGECGFNVILPNPGLNSGVECPPCVRTYQPASVKLH